MPSKKKIPKAKLLDFSDNSTANLNKLKINKILTDLISDPNEREYLNTKNIVIGIDEAGRGPVIGPLLYGLVIFTESHKLNDQCIGTAISSGPSKNLPINNPKSNNAISENIILRDSKQMSRSQRTETNTFLNKNFACATLALDAKFITAEMDRRSLNDICLWAAIQLLKFINERLFESEKQKSERPNMIKKSIRTMSGKLIINNTAGLTDSTSSKRRTITVIIDSLGNSMIPLLTLQSNFPNFIFKILPKADSLFQVVSAASVVAKVERDSLLDEIMEKHVKDGCMCSINGTILQKNVPYTVIDHLSETYTKKPELGIPENVTNLPENNLSGLLRCNGYPSDPHISLYLTNFPECPFIRFKWATVTKDQPKKKPKKFFFMKKNK